MTDDNIFTYRCVERGGIDKSWIKGEIIIVELVICKINYNACIILPSV